MGGACWTVVGGTTGRYATTSLAWHSLVQCDFLAQPFKRISAFNLCEFHCCVLIQELIDWLKTATNTDLDLIPILNMHMNLFGAKAVDAFVFAQKHHFELAALRVVVDKISEIPVNRIFLYRHIHCCLWLELDHILAYGLALLFDPLQLLKKLQGGLIRCVNLFLDFGEVRILTYDLIP